VAIGGSIVASVALLGGSLPANRDRTGGLYGVRPLHEALAKLLPEVLARHPGVAFVYLGGGAAAGDLRPGELLAIGYELRADGGEAVAGARPVPGPFDEDAFFADLAGRFDTNDLDLVRLGALPIDRLAVFLRDAVLLAAPDEEALRRFRCGAGLS
jgi:hypothetical protein